MRCRERFRLKRSQACGQDAVSVPLVRINIGCGQSPTPGWRNYDNSLSVWLAGHPWLAFVADTLGLLGNEQRRFISVARRAGMTWADATKRIPVGDGLAEVVYASHMIEHLDGNQVLFFLSEVHRVLAPNGVIRIALPDLRQLVHQYLAEGDADAFVARSLLTRPRLRSLGEKLRFLVVGDRHHLWMYDGASLVGLLTSVGFRDARVLAAGASGIASPGGLNLSERAGESVFVEACK